MALHNLRVIVIDGGKAGSYRAETLAKSDAAENIKKSPLYKAINAKQTIKEKLKSKTSPTTVFALEMGRRIASQAVKQIANYYISDIGRKSGDSNHQEHINRQIEIVGDYLSVAGGAIQGAIGGSMFGPAGTVIGLVAGAASSGVSLGFKYAERERTYAHEMFKESNNQAYNLARTSFQGFTGRLR